MTDTLKSRIGLILAENELIVKGIRSALQEAGIPDGNIHDYHTLRFNHRSKDRFAGLSAEEAVTLMISSGIQDKPFDVGVFYSPDFHSEITWAQLKPEKPCPLVMYTGASAYVVNSIGYQQRDGELDFVKGEVLPRLRRTIVDVTSNP